MDEMRESIEVIWRARAVGRVLCDQFHRRRMALMSIRPARFRRNHHLYKPHDLSKDNQSMVKFPLPAKCLGGQWAAFSPFIPHAFPAVWVALGDRAGFRSAPESADKTTTRLMQTRFAGRNSQTGQADWAICVKACSPTLGTPRSIGPRARVGVH
jgi:hypothetical protein